MAASVPAAARFTLAELGLSVSTGRVVDFRARDYLGDDKAVDAIVSRMLDVVAVAS